MKEKIIIRRYADAFLGYARQTIGLERALKELKFIREVIRDNQDFTDFLNNQEIPHTEKFVFLDQIFKDALSEEARNFIKLLLDKGRVALLAEIVNYARVNYAHGEAVDALFKTTFPLDLELLEEIKKKLEVKLKKKLNLYLNLDAELLGGMQVSIGNKIIDGSVRTRLSELRNKLMSVRVV